jgi:hypothetical protein
MARKVLGYIELVWTCNSCGTQNPGAIRSCSSCGAPQPVDVKFERVDPSTFNFIKDEALLRMAKAGPDKHCPYCGTRNVSEAKICVDCGGDLTVGATSRPSGTTVGQEQKVPEKAEAKPLSKTAIIVIIAVLLVCCLGGIFLFSRLNQSDELSATVSDAYWRRQVAVEAYQKVTVDDWQSEIPASMQAYDCSLRYRYDSDTPKQNSKEVCGEAYTVDTGTGLGEVVQDCHYEVSEYYCSYDTMDWLVIDTLVLDGYGVNAAWPTTNLSSSQRMGSSSESYVITFDTEDGDYKYTTSNYSLFQQAVPGSNWTIEINGFGDVTSIDKE